MSEVKVNSIKGVNASVAAISINNADGTCTANITNKPNRNLIINGAMQCAQYGSSGTAAFCCVDRFKQANSSVDEAPTGSQVDVASGTTPYTLGFRKAFRITNGNQTSGAQTNNLNYIRHQIESQNIAQSGWNYTDANSFITLSFWVKASVAQDYHFHVRSLDGTGQVYPMEMTLAANTWTKITRTIPGNSNLQFDNDNGDGFHITFQMYVGTQYTESSANNNQWQAYSSSYFGGKDQTSTWYTTNDATFEITGVQLEVGTVATDFEHRSFAQEIQDCYRYFYVIKHSQLFGGRAATSGTRAKWTMATPVPLRASPTINTSPFGDTWNATAYKYNGTSTSTTVPTVNEYLQNSCHICFSQLGHSLDDDRVFSWQNNAALALDAEL